jgi:hypothetical protein
MFAPPLSTIATLLQAISAQSSFRGWHFSAFSMNGLTQDSSHRLEASLNHVMGVFALHFNMQRSAERIR